MAANKAPQKCRNRARTQYSAKLFAGNAITPRGCPGSNDSRVENSRPPNCADEHMGCEHCPARANMEEAFV
jgi:hypothetical protein